MAYKILPSARRLRQLFTYDYDTGILTRNALPISAFVNLQAWAAYNKYAGRPCVAIRRPGEMYLCAAIDRRQRYMVHRIIWKMVTGKEPNVIDHIDGDPTNNRFDNLRSCTLSQNHANQRQRHPGKLKGCSWNKGAWHCRMWVRGKCYYLGRFPTQEGAHAAYMAKARELNGEFASDGRHADHN
jgi:hypothetical protein